MFLSFSKRIFFILMLGFVSQGFAIDVLDFYADLQVTRTSTRSEIRKNFIKLSVKWHPDVNQADPEKAEKEASKLNVAWKTLGDADRRARYDAIFDQLGRPPTSNEYDADAAFHEAQAEALRKEQGMPAESHVFVHVTPAKGPDPKVEDLTVMIKHAAQSYAGLHTLKFWELQGKNHSILEKAFTQIMEDPKVEAAEKNRAFDAYYRDYLFQTLAERKDMSAADVLRAISLFEAPAHSFANQNPEYTTLVREWVTTFSARMGQAALVHQRFFYGAMTGILKDSQKNGFVRRTLRRIGGDPSYDTATVINQIMNSRHLYTGTMKELIGEGNEKDAKMLLSESINRLLEFQQKIRNEPLNDADKLLVADYLFQIESLSKIGYYKQLRALANQFYKGRAYADLKIATGAEVPLREEKIINFQVFLESGLNEIIHGDDSAIMDKKFGIGAYLRKSHELYLNIASDSSIDSIDQEQAVELWGVAFRKSGEFVAQHMPLKDTAKLIAELKSTPIELKSTSDSDSEDLVSFFSKQILQHREEPLRKEVLRLGNSANKKDRKLAAELFVHYRQYSPSFERGILDELRISGPDQLRAFKTIADVWADDVAAGKGGERYERSRQILEENVAARQYIKNYSDYSLAALKRAHRSLARSEPETAATVKTGTLQAMKSGKYNCLKKIHARLSM